MQNDTNYIVFGASSELARSFIMQINSDNIFCISRNTVSLGKNSLFVEDYINNIDKIIKFCRDIENPIIIFFNGYLMENRPDINPDAKQAIKTFEINYLIPFEITKKLQHENLNIKKFVYISSFAAVRFRYKNYIYGITKRLLEESIKSLNLKNYLILRFGKINTKMSSSHSNSIFDLDKDVAAKILIKNIKWSSGLKYSNPITKFLSIIIKCLPYKIIKYFKL